MIVYLAVFLIFCLLNTALLRFAADIVVKRMPEFRTAFYLSIVSSIASFSATILPYDLERRVAVRF